MIADRYTEADEAEAAARIDRLLAKRAAQQKYIGQAQHEVAGRIDSLLIIDEELNRAQAWMDRIRGHEPRLTKTHREFMNLCDEISERQRARWS